MLPMNAPGQPVWHTRLPICPIRCPESIVVASQNAVPRLQEIRWVMMTYVYEAYKKDLKNLHTASYAYMQYLSM